MISVVTHLRWTWELCLLSLEDKQLQWHRNAFTAPWIHTSEAQLQLNDKIWTHPMVYDYWLGFLCLCFFLCLSWRAHPTNFVQLYSWLCSLAVLLLIPPWKIKHKHVKTWEGRRGRAGVKPDPHCSPWEELWTDSELGGKEVGVKS